MYIIVYECNYKLTTLLELLATFLGSCIEDGQWFTSYVQILVDMAVLRLSGICDVNSTL